MNGAGTGYIVAGYTICLAVLFLYAVSLVLRRRRLGRAAELADRRPSVMPTGPSMSAGPTVPSMSAGPTVPSMSAGPTVSTVSAVSSVPTAAPAAGADHPQHPGAAADTGGPAAGGDR